MNKLIILTIFLPFIANAQFGNQDFGIWGGVDVSTEVANRLKISGNIQFRTNDNSSRLDRYFFDLSAKYKVNKYFSAALAWRPRMVNDYSNFLFQNRVHLDLTGKIKLGVLKLYLRNRIQKTSRYDTKTRSFERVRIKAVFKLDKKIKAFIQDEFFLSINGTGISPYVKNRFGIGVEYSINDAIDIGLKYLRITEVNRYYPLRMNVIAIGVSYSIK